MSAPAWLSVMPAIPLARAVPIVDVTGKSRGVVLDPNATNPDHPIVVLETTIGPSTRSVNAGKRRVDLDDPQGFAYATWWLAGQPWMPAMDVRHAYADVLRRYALRQTTSGDRVFVARAIRTVVPS